MKGYLIPKTTQLGMYFGCKQARRFPAPLIIEELEELLPVSYADFLEERHITLANQRPDYKS